MILKRSVRPLRYDVPMLPEMLIYINGLRWSHVVAVIAHHDECYSRAGLPKLPDNRIEHFVAVRNDVAARVPTGVRRIILVEKPPETMLYDIQDRKICEEQVPRLAYE